MNWMPKHNPQPGEIWRYRAGWSTDGEYHIDRRETHAVFGHRVSPWLDYEDCDLTIMEPHDEANWLLIRTSQ